MLCIDRPTVYFTKLYFMFDYCFTVSHHFGFGLMDASAMVDKAMNWTNVPEQHKCEIKALMTTRYMYMIVYYNLVLWGNVSVNGVV